MVGDVTRAETGAGGSGGGPRRGAQAALLAATFMGILDVLIVNVAAPSIQRDLGAEFSDIQLVISAYVLAYAVGLTTGGRLGGAYGHKRVFVTGLLAFAVMSTACAAAPNVDVLVVLRIGQGLAAALMLPQVLALIQTVFPPEDRLGRWHGTARPWGWERSPGSCSAGCCSTSTCSGWAGVRCSWSTCRSVWPPRRAPPYSSRRRGPDRAGGSTFPGCC